MMDKNFMDFKTCKYNGLYHYQHCRKNECSSTELVSIAFLRLFFHSNKYSFKKGCILYTVRHWKNYFLRIQQWNQEHVLYKGLSYIWQNMVV